MVVWYIVAGLFGGVIGGLGMGGGTLLIPALVIFLSVGQHTAQSINVISFVPMSVVSVIILSKQGLIKWTNVLYVLAPAVFSAVGGAFLAVNCKVELLKILFGAFLLILGLILLYSTLKNAQKDGSQNSQKCPKN